MPRKIESAKWKRELHRRLRAWYVEHRRDLPWRWVDDPYAIWVSEIMLQQTQVSRVEEYFSRWMTQFPDVTTLAEASLDEVLKAWEGLGYYARARNLHRAARRIVEEFDGRLPQSPEALRTLPGIGRYTAGAIASIAFDQPVAAVDANLKRVFARLIGYDEPINTPAGTRALWDVAEGLLPDQDVGDWNEALMDVGATLCISGTPRCLLCPFMGLCTAQREGRQEELPRRRSRGTRPHRTVAAGVIRKESGEILIAQRPTDKMLGGLWEFPGGTVVDGESFDACLERIVREDFSVEIDVEDELAVIEHGYTHFSITLHAYLCRHVGGTPENGSVAAWRWAAPDTLDDFAWPSTGQRIIEALRDRAEV